MLVTEIETTLIYQLVFMLILLSVALTSFVILVRYTGWLKIHLDRIFDLYKIDEEATKSSVETLLFIAKAKGMELADDYKKAQEDTEEKEMPKGKYREFAEI